MGGAQRGWSEAGTDAIQDASAGCRRCLIVCARPGALTGAGVLLAELLELLGRRPGLGLLVGRRAVLGGGRRRGRGAGVRAGAAGSPVVPVAPVLPVSAGVGVGVGVPGRGGRRGRRRRHVGGALLVRHAQHRRGARDLFHGEVVAAAAGGDERRAPRQRQRRTDEAGARRRGQRGSAAMRRPQVGQSLRSFCASWSHQLQKRRFSTAHGSLDFDGGSGSTLPTTSSGSPVSRST